MRVFSVLFVAGFILTFPASVSAIACSTSLGASPDNLMVATVPALADCCEATFFDPFAVTRCVAGFGQTDVFVGVDAALEAIRADVKQAV